MYTCSISPLYPKKGNALKEVNKRKIIYPVGRLFTDIKIIQSMQGWKANLEYGVCKKKKRKKRVYWKPD